MQYAGGDFHCAIKEFSDADSYAKLKQNLTTTFLLNPLTEIIRSLDESFGKEYFTLKDIFIEERRKILEILIQNKMRKYAQIYQEMYDEGKGSIYQMQNLGLAVPEEFKIAARYSLSKKFNDLVIGAGGFVDPSIIQEIAGINFEAKALGIKLDKAQSNRIFAKKIDQNISRLAYSLEIQQADVLMELFDYVEKLELEIDISEAQNTYYTRIYHRIGEIIDLCQKSKRASEKRFAQMLLDIGERLNINTEFYRIKLDKLK